MNKESKTKIIKIEGKEAEGLSKSLAEARKIILEQELQVAKDRYNEFTEKYWNKKISKESYAILINKYGFVIEFLKDRIKGIENEI